MSLADEIRTFVFNHWIFPNRGQGNKEITIRTGDVHKKMELSNRMPAVCDAMGTKIFEIEYKVKCVDRKGPRHGQNVYYTFEI